MKRLTPAVLGSQRNGVNHVGMNVRSFGDAGPVRDTDYPTYSNALLDRYQMRNVKAVRLTFTWEAVQSTAGGPVPPAAAGFADYWSDLTSLMTRLLARGIYVSLAPWQYNRHSGDTDIVYKDAAFTPAQFADFWGKFAAATNGVTGNDQRVAFDLINEPHTHTESGDQDGDIGISLTNWFACAQAAIAAIRGAAASNTILVPGMAYADASSFLTNGSAAKWLRLTDPLKNIAVTAHCYTGLGPSSATVLPDACADLVAWARANSIKVHIGEIAVSAGTNGRPTFCGTVATAHDQWDKWSTFCAENSDVIVGWDWWANRASGDWWDDRFSCDPAEFRSGLTLDDPSGHERARDSRDRGRSGEAN